MPHSEDGSVHLVGEELMERGSSSRGGRRCWTGRGSSGRTWHGRPGGRRRGRRSAGELLGEGCAVYGGGEEGCEFLASGQVVLVGVELLGGVAGYGHGGGGVGEGISDDGVVAAGA